MRTRVCLFLRLPCGFWGYFLKIVFVIEFREMKKEGFG